MTPRPAFTRLEHDIVMGIIALLLLTILIPMLRRQRDLDRRTRCASNLKGIGTGIYASPAYRFTPGRGYITPCGQEPGRCRMIDGADCAKTRRNNRDCCEVCVCLGGDGRNFGRRRAGGEVQRAGPASDADVRRDERGACAAAVCGWDADRVFCQCG